MVTHTVTVNADGSFTPTWLDIEGDDVVEWQFSERTDTVLPADGGAGPFPAICDALEPYRRHDPNEFTGPMPVAPSGIFVLGPTEKEPLAPADRTLVDPAVWQNPDISGVFIRLLWNEVQTAPDTFVWDVLDDEMDQAIAHDKLFSVSFKAGHYGTPDWLFTDAGVTPLVFHDGATNLDPTKCGVQMTLGSPCEAAYQDAYFGLWREVAAHIRSRNDWYRALAYVKPSGANLFSHENRLPQRTHLDLPCVNNAEVWATSGFTPDGLAEFYSNQTAVLAQEFPGKSMAYMLIQAGFPKVANDGKYEGQWGPDDPYGLPKRSVLTEMILAQGRREHGSRFVVQHNALGPGDHTNKWVRQEGQEGQVTGFQTNNVSGVGDPAELESALQNAYDNSDAIFVEIYQARLLEVDADPTLLSRPLADYAEDFHQRRRDDWPHLGDPYPLTHRHRFRRSIDADTGNEIFHYVHGSKCGADGTANYGAIKLLP